MQSLSWYYARIQQMSAEEIRWRLGGALRETLDLVRFPAGLYPKPSAAKSWQDTSRGFSVRPGNLDLPEEKIDALRQKAQQIADHRLSFFQHESLYLGDKINWHRDWNQGLNAAVRPTPLVDYRVAGVSGDCKQVWEPNRHHQLVVLARAFYATGDASFAQAVWAQLRSWIEANPFGYGMNWKSPLELGVRIINWVWALDLVRAHEPEPEVWQLVFRAAAQHVWDLERKFSQGSSANNHLIGEAAGAFIATAYWPEIDNAQAINTRAAQVLEDELQRQLFASGCTQEQALGYQFFSLQFFTLCAEVGERIDKPFSAYYLERLHAGYRFLSEVAEGGTELPMFGDKDDGYVLDLGEAPHDVEAMLSLGASFFKESRVSRHENACWLTGCPYDHEPQMQEVQEAQPLSSRAYDEAGHYFLQCGSGDNRISAHFDCAPLGYGSLAAHGHADALAVDLRLGGKLMLVDPGTYDYFTYPEWRAAFRGTLAHNTVTIDGRNQSELKGPFLWGHRAESKCVSWRDDELATEVHGTHDGYAQGEKSVGVERIVQLDKVERVLVVEDRVTAADSHHYAAAWHFHPECEVDVTTARITAQRGVHRLVIRLPEGLVADCHHGDEDNKLGWYSTHYHQRQPTTCVVLRTQFTGPCRLLYRMEMMEPGAG